MCVCVCARARVFNFLLLGSVTVVITKNYHGVLMYVVSFQCVKSKILQSKQRIKAVSYPLLGLGL